jgi:hypothetical protein
MGNLFGKTCYTNKQLSKEDTTEYTKKIVVSNADNTVKVINSNDSLDETLISKLLENESIFENMKDDEENTCKSMEKPMDKIVEEKLEEKEEKLEEPKKIVEEEEEKIVEEEEEKLEEPEETIKYSKKEFLEDSNKKLFLD